MKVSNKYLDENNTELKAVILLGTLKGKKEFSHTAVLSELLIEHLQPYKVKSEIVRLVDYHIKPGLKNNMGKGDEWPKILKKVRACDILIFATPIWWGLQSSLIQRTMERMDSLNDGLLETGTSELSNKVGGLVVSGAEDGTQHVTGNLSNFLVWNGITLPPACSLSFLGDYTDETKTSLLKKFRQQKSTSSMAHTMARNLVFFARLLKANNIPTEKGGFIKDINPGAFGIRGDRKKR